MTWTPLYESASHSWTTSFSSFWRALRQTALNRKNESRVQRLTALIEKARDIREERLPPDVRLVSRLLRADYPDGSGRLLEEQRGLVNASLLKTYDRYVGQVGENISEAARQRLQTRFGDRSPPRSRSPAPDVGQE